MELIDYTEKSFVIIGNTKPFKENLKNFGGRWNGNLNIENSTASGGWIFSKKHKETVENWLKTVPIVTETPSRNVKTDGSGISPLFQKYIQKLRDVFDDDEKITFDYKKLYLKYIHSTFVSSNDDEIDGYFDNEIDELHGMFFDLVHENNLSFDDYTKLNRRKFIEYVLISMQKSQNES